MSLKKWEKCLSKKQFLHLIHVVIYKTLKEFNYTIRPYVYESKLSGDALMSFCESGRYMAIAFDYAKFKRNVGEYGYEEQFVYLVQIVSHEMRHYYQYRQMMAKNPREKEETIESWREDKVVKVRGMEKEENANYWFSARELDASLFSYVYTLRNLKSANLNAIISKAHFNALKKLYKQYGGTNVKTYFSNKVKRAVSR